MSGSPQIEPEFGARTRLADYVPARRGPTAAFEYTVTAADADADGVSIRANTDALSPSLLLNDGEFLWVSFLRGEVVHLGFGAVPAGAGHAVDGENADTTAPTLSAATILYDLLVLTYSEPLRSDPQMMSGKERGYAEKYRGAGEPIHLVAVEFSRDTRNVVAFEVEPG